MKMKEKVHKYFLAGTDEEVLIGDVITTELVKEFDDGRTLTREMEFKLTEETIPEALELGIIEEYEDEEENKDLIDFDEESFDFREAVAQDIEEIHNILNSYEHKIEVLEENFDRMWANIRNKETNLEPKINEVYKWFKENNPKEKKTASPKKK